MTDEYDPETCWTAGELRALGFVVESKVPDIGWIPCDALEFECARARPEDDGSITVTMHMKTRVSFRWIEIKAELASP